MDRVGIVSAVMPAILLILGGIGWAVKRWIGEREDKDAGVDITQGITIPVTALPDYLHSRNEQCEDENRAYMIALVRAGIDPMQVLRDSGLEPEEGK